MQVGETTHSLLEASMFSHNKVPILFNSIAASSVTWLTFRLLLLGIFSGDIYEHAVVLSVKIEDQDAFERDFFQLKPYYTDTW